MNFAQHTFQMASVQPDGRTLREHLQTVEKATGKRPAELETPEFPWLLHREWRWFQEINSARQGTGFGVNPTPYSEIRHYFELMQESPNPSQIRIIRKLDSVAMGHHAKLRREQKEADKKKRAVSRGPNRALPKRRKKH